MNKVPEKPEQLRSLTLWLPRATWEKLNKLALSRSSARRIVNRQEVVRELIKKATV